MARLNDLAPPAESIEALKRRFIRQNRELARANSIQSLRIQALESEISRLLCQNTSLHSQVISLNHEIERYESAKALNDGVHNLKARLDSKLAELGNLVAELGALPRKVNKKTMSEAAASGVDEERQSHINYRREELGPEAIAGFDDGRLPVILEDKYYPRKTLEPRELEDMENDVPGSPELGPPPVAHLDPGDSPSREEWTEPFEYVKQTYTEPEDDYKGSLYSQQPRKRGRPRLLSAPTKGDKGRPDPSVPLEESKSGVKSGHKRKFDADEEDESHSLDVTEPEDDFKFNRTDRASDKVLGHPAAQSPQADVGQEETPRDLKDQVRIRRKVLEPKSTNMNNTSPKKQRASENKKSRIPEDGRKTARADSLAKPRQIKQEDENSISERYAFHKGKSGKADIDMNEKAEATSHTPAKFVSPQLQSVSATTPSELGGSARPARRPRNVVSYVEPNLKAKMRRPTEELITAVPEDHSRRTSNSRTSAGRGEEGETITLGAEMEDGSKSQTLSTDSVSQLQEPGSPSPRERGQATISGNRKGSDRRRRTGRGESLSTAAEDALQPELDTDSLSAMSTGKGSSTVTRQSRRHSSNPTGYHTKSGRDSSPHQDAEYLTSTHSSETRSHRGRRRGESTNEVVEDDDMKGTRLRADARGSLEPDDAGSSTAKIAISASNKALMEAELLRRGRVSARRRSMMF
ncbi:hypothetical protein DTO021D3_8548 [Paecilomyces variotii]|nr:hypothetical protein DTO032I3_6863 [Paecilomyces variotii]KAJ9274598.1 hypothetical protein DTO021D3_8548 [Paecilomyces variotii]KAJ9341328.1 hypothetical protein DTO027B6_6169 [Paecilomyces variotii]KAJ9378749.1 hypothetical protein DTO032I4_7503 [Paecilomyces variotii]